MPEPSLDVSRYKILIVDSNGKICYLDENGDETDKNVKEFVGTEDDATREAHARAFYYSKKNHVGVKQITFDVR